MIDTSSAFAVGPIESQAQLDHLREIAKELYPDWSGSPYDKRTHSDQDENRYMRIGRNGYFRHSDVSFASKTFYQNHNLPIYTYAQLFEHMASSNSKNNIDFATQIKPGTMIRLVSKRGHYWNSTGAMDRYLGRVVRVTSVLYGNHFSIEQDPDDTAKTEAWRFQERDIVEIIEEEQVVSEEVTKVVITHDQLVPGMKVKLTHIFPENWVPKMIDYVGKVVTIGKVGPNDFTLVDSDYTEQTVWYFDAKNIIEVLYNPSTQPTEVLEVEDEVKVTESIEEVTVEQLQEKVAFYKSKINLYKKKIAEIEEKKFVDQILQQRYVKLNDLVIGIVLSHVQEKSFMCLVLSKTSEQSVSIDVEEWEIDLSDLISESDYNSMAESIMEPVDKAVNQLKKLGFLNK